MHDIMFVWCVVEQANHCHHVISIFWLIKACKSSCSLLPVQDVLPDAYFVFRNWRSLAPDLGAVLTFYRCQASILGAASFQVLQ